VACYVDDIVIFSANEVDHKSHIKTVCEKLEANGLKLNDKKSTFFKPSVNFLGYEINQRGIKPMPERVVALKNLSPPTDKKSLQRYIGMFAFYQRCVPNFSDKAKPLRDLIKSSTFCWSDYHDKAFETLKSDIASATELSYIRENAPLTVTADASQNAIGACLHQVVDGISVPVSFFSRTLSDVETRYSTFDRELLAVFAAVKKWKNLLCSNKVTIFTDHKPIVGAIKNSKDRDSDRQQRQITFISEYCTDVVHIAGNTNVVADTLSRAPNILNISSTIPIDLISIAKAQNSCNVDFSMYKSYSIDNYNLFCEVSSPNPRPFIPDDLRKPVFDSLHRLSHPGWKSSCRLVGSRYFWPSLKADVKKWVSECLSCQESKVHRHVKRPLSELPVPSQRFTRVHIDIVGPLESTDRSAHRYLVTMMDSHTRWMEVVPVSDISAETICNVFLYHWVARFGPPLYLISDKGTQFTSELLMCLNKALGIHQIRTSAYNPKANGLVERMHRSLKASLRARHGHWLQQLPFVLLGLRAFPDENGSSPFSRLTGEQPMVPHILIQDANSKTTEGALQALQFPYKETRTRRVVQQSPQQLNHCDYVWLRLDRIRRPMEAPYQGPFRVISRRSDTFTIEVRGKPTSVAIERLKPAIVSTEVQADASLNDSISATSGDVTPVDVQPDPQPEETTKSGRRVKFRHDDEYHYY